MKKLANLLILLLWLSSSSFYVFAQTDPSATNEQLQERIRELLNQVQKLQQQVIELGGAPQPAASGPVTESTTTPTALPPELTRPLSFGSRGDDVKQFQEFLSQFKEIYPEGLVTGYFGPLTEKAVKKWQEKNGIEAVGLIGPKSRARIQELITEGAGASGIAPPGLLTTPAIPAVPATPAQPAATTTATTTPAIPAIPATPAAPAAAVQFATTTAATAFPVCGQKVKNVPADYSTIQAAIDAAKTGDTIKIAAGTYNESLQMKSGVCLDGAGIDKTIISIPGSWGIKIWNNHYVIIKNLTIKDSGQKNSDGGGIYIKNSNNVQLEWCRLTNNLTNNGGGLAVQYSNNLSIKRCLIDHNYATNVGGGVFIAESSGTFTNVTIADNVAVYVGGNIPRPTGGVYVAPKTNLTILNSILWNNIRSDLYIFPELLPITNVKVSYSDIDGWYSGINNLSADPKFDYDGSYHLRDDSSMFNAGDPASQYYDPDGTRNDIGIYYFLRPDYDPPAISSISASNITSTSATITWTTNELAYSQVEYGTTSGAYSLSTTLTSSRITHHSVNLTNLKSDTIYYYRVKSKDFIGNLATSYEYNFRTLVAPITVTAPVPSSTPPSSSTTTTSPTSTTTTATTTTTTTTATTATTTTTVATTTTTGDTTPPTASILISSSISYSGISKFFVTSSDNVGVIGIQVKKNGINFGSEIVATSTAALPGTYEISWDTTNEANGSYIFSAVVRDAAGNTTTAYANTVTLNKASTSTSSADTTPPDVNVVTIFAQNITQTSATIVWQTDEASDSMVRYTTDSTCSSNPNGCNYDQTATGNSNTTSHSVSLSGLTVGTRYYYKVSSTDAAGNKEESPMQVFDTSSAPQSSSPSAAWIRQLGSVNAYGAATDSNGNTYMVGDTGSSIDGQTLAGSNDGFIAKYDSSGNKVWVRLLGSSGWDMLEGAITNGTNVYVVGLTYGSLEGQANAGNTDAIVAKYDSDGNKIWVKQFGAALNDQLYDAAIDTSGNIYVSGYSDTSLDGQTAAGNTDALLVKYDSNGNKLWTRLLGNSGYDKAEGLAVDSAGNAYITGWTRASVAGQTALGLDDVFLAKYDSGGNRMWVKQDGTSSSDYGFGAGTDSSGNIYISGYTSGAFSGQTNAGVGTHDAFLLKYDSSGNRIWARQIGGSNNEITPRVAVSAQGIFLSSYTEGPAFDGLSVAGSADAFLTKYDSSGNKIWSKLASTPSHDTGNRVTTDGSAGVYIIGQTSGTFSGQTASGGSFIAKYSADAQSSMGSSAASTASILESTRAILEQLLKLLKFAQ